MSSLKAINARLDEIEQQIKQHQAEPLTIVIRFVRPGHLEDEIMQLQDQQGSKWCRESGENEDQFIERAQSQARRNQHSVATLLGNVSIA
jgi:hypothetical protein